MFHVKVLASKGIHYYQVFLCLSVKQNEHVLLLMLEQP